jgi:Predicted Co/Zn/Cd cation transporters
MAALSTKWMNFARRLVLTTLIYNVAEAILAIGSGIVARSIALVGFGLDSIIECAAAGVLLWHLRAHGDGDSPQSERAERKVRRFIGASFIVLALYVLIEAGLTLWHRAPANESLVGIVLAAVSLIIMPLVAWGKIKAARALKNAPLLAEAKETLACSYLSLTLLMGLIFNAWLSWWWADPVAALLMIPWLVKEGIEGLEIADPCGTCA